MNRKLWTWVGSVTVAVLLVVGIVVQLAHVHAQTGYWGLSVSAAEAPSRVQYDGRAYDRGDVVAVPHDAVRRGRTDRGAAVYKPAGDEDDLSVVIYVETRGRAWSYGLVGGP